MREIPFLNLSALHQKHAAELGTALSSVIESSTFIGGPEVQKFEKAFAQWVAPEMNVVGCANGTDAVSIAAKALEIPPESEAILPAMTFVATAEALLHLGIKIRLVDIDEDSWLMPWAAVQKALTPQTKLIVPVHLYGQVCPMSELQTIARNHGCFLIEDAAQAHGARWNDNPVGHYSDLATFSFFPGKNLGAFGDGGAILSRNAALISRCRALANHGGLRKYEHEIVGWNSRLDALQAAVLNVKLKYLTEWNEARRRLASFYSNGLSGIKDLVLPKEKNGSRGVYHLYVVLVDKREDFVEYMKSRGIHTGIHYPKALHELPALKHLFAGQKFPKAERLAAHGVSLPMCPTLSMEDAEYVVKQIRTYFQGST